MGLIPSGEPGKLLQWYDAGGTYALRNRTMDDLLDEIASYTGPTANKYYLDVSAADVQPELGAVTGAGVVAGLAISGSAVFSIAAASGTGEVATVTASAGAGTINVDLAAVSGTGELAGVTVTTPAGGGSATDDFNRVNASDLNANTGATNWTQLTGTSGRFRVTGNKAYADQTGGSHGDRWTAGSGFNSDQYAESTDQYTSVGGIAVRMQPAAHSCYYIRSGLVDEGEGWMTLVYTLVKIVDGAFTDLGSWALQSGGSGAGWSGPIRVEASGSTISFKTGDTHGGTFTERISATDTALTGGSPGLYAQAGYAMEADTWYGGNL